MTISTVVDSSMGKSSLSGFRNMINNSIRARKDVRKKERKIIWGTESWDREGSFDLIFIVS